MCVHENVLVRLFRMKTFCSASQMAVQAMLSDLNHSPVCLNLNSPLAWIKHSAPQYCSLSQAPFCDVRSLRPEHATAC